MSEEILIYYVYILFDWLGIPRYIGRGQGNRWLHHERYTDRENYLKNEFIEQIWIMLEDVPKIKIRENLSIDEANKTEIALIKAIGRLNKGEGPLLNLTNGGDGTPGRIWNECERLIASERTAAQMAAIDPEERLALAIKASMAAREKQLTNPVPLEIKSEQVKKAHATRRLNDGYKKQRGKRWITNGVIERKIGKDEPLPEGFKYARIYVIPPPEGMTWSEFHALQWANMTEEDKLERLRKIHTDKAKEARAAGLRKRTKEQHKLAGEKGNATKRRNGTYHAYPVVTHGHYRLFQGLNSARYSGAKNGLSHMPSNSTARSSIVRNAAGFSEANSNSSGASIRCIPPASRHALRCSTSQNCIASIAAGFLLRDE